MTYLNATDAEDAPSLLLPLAGETETTDRGRDEGKKPNKTFEFGGRIGVQNKPVFDRSKKKSSKNRNKYSIIDPTGTSSGLRLQHIPRSPPTTTTTISIFRSLVIRCCLLVTCYYTYNAIQGIHRRYCAGNLLSAIFFGNSDICVHMDQWMHVITVSCSWTLRWATMWVLHSLYRLTAVAAKASHLFSLDVGSGDKGDTDRISPSYHALTPHLDKWSNNNDVKCQWIPRNKA